MSLEAGQLINDHVRLVRLLGRGGMGSVWVAHHEGLAIDVAVKFIAPELLHADETLVLARFKREAQLAAKLDNPHTVRVLDHGVTDGGVPYIVMELLRGRTLAECVLSETRLPVADAVAVVRDIARGLEHAHSLGIVHRDIKPPNIFLATTSDDRRVTKILDFGIAKSQSATEPSGAGTSSGVLIGTPHYMSPEQLMRAGPPDRSADVWALGIVAYEILVGRPPFHGETLAATLIAITRADLRAPTRAVPGLSPALDKFFRRALSLDPAQRFKTASALAEAFAAAADGSAPTEIPSAPRDPLTDASLPTEEFLRLTTPASSKEAVELAPTLPGAGIADALIAKETPLATTSTRVRNGTSSRTWLLAAGVAAFATVAGVVAWRLTAPPSPTPVTTNEAPPPTASIATPEVSASAPPSAPIEAPPKLGTLGRTSIPQGFAPISNVFVPAFEVAREEGDSGLDFITSLRSCDRKKMSLCTEAQWQRACEALPLVGTRPSWTLSPDEGGLAIRGGESCGSRAVAPADTSSPERIAVCCTRAIGTTSSNQKSHVFLVTTSGKILNIERLVNAANGAGLADLSAPKLNLFGKLEDHAEIGQHVGWTGRRESFYFDTCDASIHDIGALRGWSANCVGTLVGKKNEVERAYRLIVFGDGGLLEELREPKARASLTSKPAVKP